LTREQAPEIRGIRLGTTADQLLVLFPEERNQHSIHDAVKNSKLADQYGVGRFDLRADNAAPNPRLAGINYITVDFIDEKVTGFHVSYQGPEWKTVDQFVTRVSDMFHLPNAASWETGDESRRSLKCEGFAIDVYAFRGSGENWVRVRDNSVQRVVEDRREAAKEKERQAFRP
jgi:hypothetical protein